MAKAQLLPLDPARAFEPPDTVTRLGLVLLATDFTTEADFATLVGGPGASAGRRIALHANRIDFDNPTTRESLLAIGPRLEAGCAQLLPDAAFRAIYFSCTSASAVLGHAAVASAIAEAKPEAVAVNPISAARAALLTLGAKRISLMAPYTTDVTEQTAAAFEEAGFSLDRVTCWGLTDDREMAQVKPEAIAEAASKAMAPTSAALFISCTAVRAALAAPLIEAAIDRPVVTSNLAAAWACRHLVGLTDAWPAAGRLLGQPFDAALL